MKNTQFSFTKTGWKFSPNSKIKLAECSYISYDNCIINELQKAEVSDLKKFLSLFPPSDVCREITVPNKDIIIKSRTPGNSYYWLSTPLAQSFSQLYGIKIRFKDYTDFWKRWNKFKKLQHFW